MRPGLFTRPRVIIAILILQIIPLLLFPPRFFSLASQVWWLPALLVLMTLIADIQLIVRRSSAVGPWLLIGFAQGFNIISRVMMVWPNATVLQGESTRVNWPYLFLTLTAIAVSWLLLIYTEKPSVREGLLRG